MWLTFGWAAGNPKIGPGERRSWKIKRLAFVRD
jgi:hypothetical protein